jgi:uncharacterized protein YeaO (DUF488 family)
MAGKIGPIRLKRVYEPAAPEDGARFLVERLWPRGVRRDALPLTDWLRDVAPSPALRQWYGHDPARWPEFRRRYLAELRAPERAAALRRLEEAARAGPVTLLFAARDEVRSSAAVLREVLLRRLRSRARAGRAPAAPARARRPRPARPRR